MRRRWILIAAIWLCLAPVLLAGPPRLVVDNRTALKAVVQVWRYTGDRWDWITVANVAPKTWVPVFDVKANDRFRAVQSKRPPLNHTVRLYPDRNYGGSQDIWLLQ